MHDSQENGPSPVANNLKVPYATKLHSTSPSCSTHYRQAYMEQRHRPRTSDCCPRRAANSFPKFIVVSQCSQVQSYKALPSYRSTLVAVLLPRLLMCTDAPYTAVHAHLVLPICVMGKMGGWEAQYHYVYPRDLGSDSKHHLSSPLTKLPRPVLKLLQSLLAD